MLKSLHIAFILNVFAACILSCFPGEASAQSSHQIFDRLTTEQGLSSNKVEAILQDKNGFYWIATQNGLNRFDGTNFKVFLHNKNDSTSLTHNYCTALQEDRYGNIWVSTYKGISVYQKDKGTFAQHYLENDLKNFELANRVHNLVKDHQGNIWIAGNGLWKYDLSKDTIFYVRPVKSSTTPSYQLITQLLYDPQLNGLWFTSGAYLFFYSISENVFHHRQHNPKSWKVFEIAHHAELTLDRNNMLWFRSKKEQALAYFDSQHNQVTITEKKILHGVKKISSDEQNRIWIFYWLAPAEIYDLSSRKTDTEFFSQHHDQSAISKQATFLFIDNQKNHWIGSGNGISIYNMSNQYYRLHQLRVGDDPGEEPVKINSIAQTKNHYLWIATNYGLFQYDLQTGTSNLVFRDPEVTSITTLCADGEKLWLGLYDRVLCYDTKSRSIEKTLSLKAGVFFIRNGMVNDLWIGFWYNGLIHLNKSTGLDERFSIDAGRPASVKSNSLITGLTDGQYFWIGYNAGLGFSKFDWKADTWHHFHPQENDLSNSNAGTITVISKDASGDMWLGTHGAGVFRFDDAAISYFNYDQNNGLNSNYINSIISDSKNNLWISTADGMNYMSAATKTIRSLDMGLIFPNNDFAANGIKGIDSMLYFFCKNEFVVIDPDKYETENTFHPLVISSFKIFDDEYNLANDTAGIHLTHKENFFSFEFSAIRSHPLKAVKYAYMLEGFDHNWKIVSHQPVASYTNVPDGSYTFKVKAMNDEGQWSEPLINMPVHVAPPFWRTWWFIMLSIALILSAIYAFYNYRIQQIKKIYSVRSKISRDLHDDIGASLSSIHFNSSLAEKEMIEDPKKATEILHQINKSSRQVIENISDIIWANTDKKDTSSLAGRIKNYGYDLLSQQNIECRYTIDPQVEKRLSNPEARRNILLIVKEALNNIAKYSQSDFVEIRIAVNGVTLHVDISDNGKGFDPNSSATGNGLVNMEKRTKSLGGRFSIQSVPGKGTSVQCSIPLPNISDT